MKGKASELETAALRIWRQRKNVDAEFWKIDATCKCNWCVAKRKFRQACEDYVKRRDR